MFRLAHIASVVSRRRALSGFGILLPVGGLAVAQHPEKNISAQKHPNLAAAQRLCGQASERILEAQRANEWDMGGHAQKAKNLLEEAAHELKLAAEAANRNKH